MGNQEKILTSVKRLLGGITEDYTVFDPIILIHTNAVIATLTQLGVGPTSGYALTTGEETWADYLGAVSDNLANLEMVKTYIGLKVKMIFDPPQASSAMEALKALIAEYEWRINVMVDPMNYFVEEKQEK